jgi:hypothetical protein
MRGAAGNLGRELSASKTCGLQSESPCPRKSGKPAMIFGWMGRPTSPRPMERAESYTVSETSTRCGLPPHCELLAPAHRPHLPFRCSRRYSHREPSRPSTRIRSSDQVSLDNSSRSSARLKEARRSSKLGHHPPGGKIRLSIGTGFSGDLAIGREAKMFRVFAHAKLRAFMAIVRRLVRILECIVGVIQPGPLSYRSLRS